MSKREDAAVGLMMFVWFGLGAVFMVMEIMATMQYMGWGLFTTLLVNIFIPPVGVVIGIIACFAVGWWYVPVAPLAIVMLLTMLSGGDQ